MILFLVVIVILIYHEKIRLIESWTLFFLLLVFSSLISTNNVREFYNIFSHHLLCNNMRYEFEIWTFFKHFFLTQPHLVSSFLLKLQKSNKFIFDKSFSSSVELLFKRFLKYVFFFFKFSSHPHQLGIEHCFSTLCSLKFTRLFEIQVWLDFFYCSLMSFSHSFYTKAIVITLYRFAFANCLIFNFYDVWKVSEKGSSRVGRGKAH